MFSVLLTILLNVIFPVFILIGCGVLLHRIFRLDLNTLSKITMYCLLPVVGFVNMYQNDIDKEIFLKVIMFQIVLSVILMLISFAVVKTMRLDKGKAANFKNSIVLLNSGNYGLPVSELVFQSNPLGMTIQVIVMAIQNIITYTYGLFNSISVRHQGANMLGKLLKMPIIYAIILGILFQAYNVKIPSFLWNPIENIANAFLAVALLTLGAQMAFIKLLRVDFLLILSCIGRLIISPIIAFVLITIMGLSGTTAQALFIASSFPASRNSAQFALEFNHYPESAAQTVLVTTLLSSLTVTFVIYLSGLIF